MCNGCIASYLAAAAAARFLGDVEGWRLPPDRIEIRDPDTGEVRAYWGEHGIFEVLPPRWRR